MDQLNKIIDILGKLSSSIGASFVMLIMDYVRYPKRGDDHKSREPKGLPKIPLPGILLTVLQAQAYIRSLPYRKPMPFDKLFPDADEQGMKAIS